MVTLACSGSVERIDWLGAGVAVVLYAQPEGTRIAWVDPTTGEITKRVRLGVAPYQAVSGGGRLVLLLPPRKGIGTARLEIVGADGRTRIVRLAYPQGEWVRLAAEGMQGWRELEAERLG